MKISESWLREWVNPPGGTEALVQQLTMLGLEVESAVPVAPALDRVVAGRVLEVAAHPDADRLRVCRVDAGGPPLQIVCGAANVRAGGCYPVALPGARLPGGLTIKSTTLRGVRSDGMLCSAAELGLTEVAAGLLELDPGALPGKPVGDVLQLDDRILDLNITPNRADCFCVIGLARDVAAKSGMACRQPEVPAVPVITGEMFPVELQDAEGCPRFASRIVRNIKPGATTPLWMQERLRRSGVRPIGPVVDITNYVMLELGQPLHAYDLDLLKDRIVVRRGRPGERLDLLTGAEAAIGPDVLVIADNRGAIGIAGIMGGASTAVSDQTRHVLIESAFFPPAIIAGRARRLGLQTDASVRFERGVDPAQQVRAIERATALLVEMAGGDPGPCNLTVATSRPEVRRPILLRRERLARVLGLEVNDTDVEAILARLGMTVQRAPAGWQVGPPTFRFDICLEVDLIEEIARIHGYEQIPETPGQQATRLGEMTDARVSLARVRSALVERGYQEAVTFSFTDPELDALLAGTQVRLPLANPISADLAVMRQSLWPGLVIALRHNLARQQRRVRLFEYGVSFAGEPSDIKEQTMVAGIAIGATLPEQWGVPTAPVDFFDIKSDLEALLALTGSASGLVSFARGEHPALQPGRTARIERGSKTLGWLGVMHPALATRLGLPEAPVLFELAYHPAFVASRPTYHGLSRFPAVRRDLALLVGAHVPVADLLRSIAEAGGTVLRETVVFDVYAGERIDKGQKSVALGLILQETSRTLTDAEVEQIVTGVLQRLAREFNVKIRQ